MNNVAVNARDVEWTGKSGVYSNSSVKSNTVLQVYSPKTNKTIDFKVDQKEYTRSEFWDGEFLIFRNDENSIVITVFPNYR